MWLKKINIVHKREECIGCGSCVLLAPRCRSMDHDDGKATLKWPLRHGKQGDIGEIDEDELPENREAAAACPMNIIRIHG